jgi:hypothetical protein
MPVYDTQPSPPSSPQGAISRVHERKIRGWSEDVEGGGILRTFHMYTRFTLVSPRIQKKEDLRVYVTFIAIACLS